MSPTDVTPTAQPPKRADARRNYDKLVNAARRAFAENGTEATLEDVAQRAGVGIGTLYRHFPTRHDLVEAAYREGVEEVCAAADKYADQPPWEALTGWLHELVAFAANKRPLSEELLANMDGNAPVVSYCSGQIYGAGEPLLKRAQEAGVVRPDAEIGDVTKMVSGIAALRTADAEQVERILAIALDGLRT